MIEYNEATKSLQIECKVFCDDFTSSINKTNASNINLNTLSKKDNELMADYFNDYIKISINDKPITLSIKATEVLTQYNVIIVKFSDNTMKLKKGDKLEISNTLFFKEFSYMQSNRLTVRLPPTIKEDNHELNMNNYTINYTL